MSIAPTFFDRENPGNTANLRSKSAFSRHVYVSFLLIFRRVLRRTHNPSYFEIWWSEHFFTAFSVEVLKNESLERTRGIFTIMKAIE